MKQLDKQSRTEASSRKQSLEASRGESDKPQKMYYQDEEGFFSNVFSLNPSSMFKGDHEAGGSKGGKGILFFSRLSGAGRKDSDPNSGSQGRGGRGSIGFKTGGFQEDS